MGAVCKYVEYAVCLANVVLSKIEEDKRKNNTFNSDHKYL